MLNQAVAGYEENKGTWNEQAGEDTKKLKHNFSDFTQICPCTIYLL